jgi:orotate phosphoribosyltransferase
MEYTEVDKQLALVALKIGAIKIRPTDPFTWAAGWKSPIYNDNRRLLYDYETRELVQKGFGMLLQKNYPIDKPIIAGVATAGIPHSAILAYNYRLQFIYIREKAKDHGMGNQIECIDPEIMLTGKEVVVLEDLISTGKSSVSAVQAGRDRGAIINNCFCIFNYGFPKAQQMFGGKIAFSENGQVLDSPCAIHSLFTYPTLLNVGVENGYINKDQEEFLSSWNADPQKWSDDWKASHPA